MTTHNICFHAEIMKINIKRIPPLIWISDNTYSFVVTMIWGHANNFKQCMRPVKVYNMCYTSISCQTHRTASNMDSFEF